MTNPVVVVCLDGADLDVVDSLVASGRLPWLADLHAAGAAVDFDTPGRVIDLSVWAPLLAGAPPGDHGLAHFEEFVPDTMGLRLRREGDLESLWLHLPDHGQGAVVLDPPETHPHPDSRASETCCWHVHGPSHGPLVTDPALDQLLPRRRVHALNAPTHFLGQHEERQLLHDVQASMSFREQVWRSVGFDRPFTCVGAYELHTVGHGLGHHGWHHDHWYKPEWRDPAFVSTPYETLDAMLSRALPSRARTNLAVILARGMRPADHVAGALEGLLERAGLLRLADGGGAVASANQRQPVTDRALRVVRRILPEELRERLAIRFLPEATQHHISSDKFRSRFDWSSTAMVSLPTWRPGLLRANVRGREAEGIVEPDDLHALLQAVAKLVRGLVDEDTGRPVAEDIMIGPDRYPGLRADDLPDLIITWRAAFPVRRVRHPELGSWSIKPRLIPISEHTMGARVVLAGPDVTAAGVADARTMQGVAPTVLALAGITQPSTMSGSTWHDIIARP